jgi:HAMP domain-containing protein
MSLPKGFPDCSDEDLRDAIGVNSQYLKGPSGITESMRWGPVLQLLLAEQQARHMRRSNETALGISADALEISRRGLTISRRAFGVAVASVVLSLVAALMAVAALRSSSSWETRQLAVLGKLRDDVAAVRAIAERPQPAPPVAAGRGSTSAKPRR